MTKQIEEIFNLPHLEDLIENDQEDSNLNQLSIALEKSYDLEKKLSDQNGIIEHSKEMDQIYNTAFKAHKDILDLGFNIEAKHAGPFFESSARYLEMALKASQSKIDSKMRALKLGLDRERLDHLTKKNEHNATIIDENNEDTIFTDRNAMMDRIRKKK